MPIMPPRGKAGEEQTGGGGGGQGSSWSAGSELSVQSGGEAASSVGGLISPQSLAHTKRRGTGRTWSTGESSRRRKGLCHV